MAAYAALVSLEHIIVNLENHSRPPIAISLHNQQPYPLTKNEPISLHKEQVHLLIEKVTFLQEFLQVYNSNLPYRKEADPLETRIARAAYAAEDAIESHIYYQLTNKGEKMSSGSLYKALKKVIQDMASIEKEAMGIHKGTGWLQLQLHAKSTTRADAYRSSSSKKKSMMVGADDQLLELKDKLTSNHPDLQTIPIVGMGGSGKTTLALNIYQDRLIGEHFDIHAWVTISQEYSTQQILVRLLTKLIKEFDHELSEGELGEMLHKHLFGKRYMIILDDVWSVKAWDGVKRFLPNNKNGSRIVITTRIKKLASALPNSNRLGMKLLDEGASWDLLSQTVFGEKHLCPLELEEVGKKIGKSCKGLPLSIVVVGGLLTKSEQTVQLWEIMAGNLNAIVNLEDNERCLRTLYMSYKQPPVNLKAFFLYMGIYREDHEICISKLVRLWVAGGFLKPISGERPEDVARAYLNELIDRNLILIHKIGSIGSIKECKVHDLLRDLCLREAQKEGFYTVYPGNKIEDGVSRTVMPAANTIPKLEKKLKEKGLTMPLGRSLIFDGDIRRGVPPQIFRLTRISHSIYGSVKTPTILVNSRFTDLCRCLFTAAKNPYLSSLICLSWNLHTLIVHQPRIIVPSDMWYMSHIRHLYFNGLSLPAPPPDVGANGIVVLRNLQTLGVMKDFTCSEEVVKRIPNIRKLQILYDRDVRVVDKRHCLNNLYRLDKLESLTFNFDELKCRINYPQSLKKLSLRARHSSWHDMLDKIGALPLLDKLNISGGTWETTEGQFRSLKFLSLRCCRDLKVWTSEASHFPRLEQLHINELYDLEEISSEFAEIPTLGLISIIVCSDSVIKSAKRILEEQEESYGEEDTTLRFQVELSGYNDRAAESFRSPNFSVIDFCHKNEFHLLENWSVS